MPRNLTVRRATARVLLAGPNDAVLLLHCRISLQRADDYCWVVPGGAIKDGETPQGAAVRELREETGRQLRAADLGSPVAYATGEWSDGTNWYEGHDSFFFVRTDVVTVDGSGLEEHERSLVLGHRWWTVADLEGSDETIFPVGLAGLLDTLLADGPPAEPILLPY
jgi:8-oxo-dGTP pyrophosphatase MutT (NUDIX family)